MSASFAVFALRTATFGALMNSATRAALFTIKPTLSIAPNKRSMPISTGFDTAGPMAKSPKDAAELLTLLVDLEKTSVLDGGYAAMLGGDWKDIKVGALDPESWKMASSAIKYVQEATTQMVNSILPPEDIS